MGPHGDVDGLRPALRVLLTRGSAASPGIYDVRSAVPRWPQLGGQQSSWACGRGTSSPGLRSKKPTGLSMKPIATTGITGHSCARNPVG